MLSRASQLQKRRAGQPWYLSPSRIKGLDYDSGDVKDTRFDRYCFVHADTTGYPLPRLFIKSIAILDM